jgi:hypothetical protein
MWRYVKERTLTSQETSQKASQWSKISEKQPENGQKFKKMVQ